MKTSIIICTYNEEKTIAGVVSACCKMNKDCEVIVIDDGSTDSTETILTDLLEIYRFTYERLPENMGKSWAMVYGVEIAYNDIILFFDADVSNIRKEHFQKLLEPIQKNQADMVLGQPSDTLIDYRINPFKALTGERALIKKDIIPLLDDIRETRFGAETYINLYFQASGKRISYTILEGLSHPVKYQKTKPVQATREFIREGQEIAATFLHNYNLLIQRLIIQLKKHKLMIKNPKHKRVKKTQVFGIFYFKHDN